MTKNNKSSDYLQHAILKAQKSRGQFSKNLLLSLLEFESVGNSCYGIYDYPIVPDKADGALIWDIDGKEYLDCLSGFSIANTGHNNKDVNKQIINQLKRIPQYAEMPTPIRLEFVKKFTQTFPGGKPAKVLLTVTGSEAVEVAVKLARWYTQKPYIMVPFGDYHGITTGTIPFTPKACLWEYFKPVLPTQPVHYFQYPYCLRCPYDKKYPNCNIFCISYIERLLKSGTTPLYDPSKNRCEVAAILIEPMQASIGYIIPPKLYFSRLKELCDEFGILLIIDEIQTGLGRTGEMWACENFDIVPDIITSGKSLGGGIPLSAVFGKPEIMDSWGHIAHGSTFGGYALGCAGGVAVLDILQTNNFLQKVKQKGKLFVEILEEQLTEAKVPSQINGCGLFIGLEFFKSQNDFLPNPEIVRFIRDEALKQGLLFEISGPLKNRINLIPPLVISDSQIKKAAEIIVDCAAIYIKVFKE